MDATALTPFDRLRLAALRTLDRVFPPEPSSRMTPEVQTAREIDKASGSMGAYLAELESRDIDVLDYGCGWGGETLWLARHVRSVVGVDIQRSSIEHAHKALAESSLTNCRFEWSPNGRLPLEEATVDAVFSTDTFEHVMDLPLSFGEIFRVLRPGGRLVTRFGPLFYSPYGYHLRWACQVPWAHIVFGLRPMMVLRDERAGDVLDARTWQDTGLNQRRFDEFERAARQAGFYLIRFLPVPVQQVRWLTGVPMLKDFFIFGIDCVAERPGYAT
jgi:SAM-dependent methyltransferase